jgi:N utilization substance protein B
MTEPDKSARSAPKPAGRRSVARLFAVQALYEIEFSGKPAEGVIQDFRDARLGQEIEGEQFRQADPEWFGDIVRGTLKRQAEIDDQIRATMPRAEGLERLEAILRLAIRAATYELLGRIDVPASTVIDEYLGVVRAFFSPREIKLANGVLDGLARRLRPNEFTAR